jgi:hypothetical protein
MHKSAVSVWKAARANVNDLPECFPGMNEAQFANLAFDQHCHVSNEITLNAFRITHNIRSALLQTSALWTGCYVCAYVRNAQKRGKYMVQTFRDVDLTSTPAMSKYSHCSPWKNRPVLKSVNILFQHEKPVSHSHAINVFGRSFVAARSREVAFIHELDAIKEHWRTLKDNEARQAYARERRAFKTAVFQVCTFCRLDGLLFLT